MKRVTIATLGLVLLAAGPVMSSGAWVLWVTFVKPGYEPKLVLALDSSEKCQGALKALLEMTRMGGAKVKGAFVTHPDGTESRIICLPDTIDPRGPKAK